MRRAIKFTVGATFTTLLAGGIAFNNWPLATTGFWGAVWVSTWE